MVGAYRVDKLGFRLAGGAHVVPAGQFAAIEEADRIVRAAEQEAQRILAEAQAVYEAEKKRGWAEGQAKGRLDVMAMVLDDVAELDRGLGAIEGELSRLVASAVRKVIETYDETGRIEALVRRALHKMRREKRAELKVPTAWVQHLKSRIGAIAAEFPEIELIEVVEDPALSGDHVVLESSVGRVDADLASHMEDLETVIRSAHVRATADRLDTLLHEARP